ncbi:MAG: GGDEF domain-containing protein [Betaproteobacteria bacterium]|nr:GGDEF domain-containing protein [Betaproteobacteria bacterium]
MPSVVQRFAPDQEARFKAQRRETLAVINVTTFWMVALLVLAFSVWDAFVDPVNWPKALGWRSAGVVVILGTGFFQRWCGRSDWAPAIAKVRFAASTVAVAAALAVVKDGFLVGLAGLVAVFLASPYIAVDRRDYIWLNAVPLAIVGAIMAAIGLERFVVINAWCFLLMALVVGFLLTTVFEITNRRAFKLEEALSREARTDSLTGIDNRRALDERGLHELRRSARNGKPTSVILLDIDHFKRINDNYGHTVGDRVIQSVSHNLAATLRATDRIGRWGGEEFLVILPETDAVEASHLAERMRDAIAVVPVVKQPIIKTTISLGVASVFSHGVVEEVWSDVLKAADGALHQAKAEGRNRVVVASARVDSANS